MKSILLLTLGLCTLTFTTHAQNDAAAQAAADEEAWLPTLITDTPQEGFGLAVTLARKGVGVTQPDAEVLRELRPAYAHDADSLMAASQVIALHFQTIAAANGYWLPE